MGQSGLLRFLFTEGALTHQQSSLILATYSKALANVWWLLQEGMCVYLLIRGLACYGSEPFNRGVALCTTLLCFI